jgi:hypothetical protein
VSDDYLWDKTGKDAEVEALENLLRPLALAPGRAPRATRAAFPGGGAGGLFLAFLSAAAVALVSALVAFDQAPVKGPEAHVQVTTTAWSGACRQGEWVRCEERRATIDLAGLGTVVAEPNARLQVVRLSSDLQKLRLELGTIHATISGDARPRLFQVETPVTTCVDLGCRYDLTVDDEGRSLVHVTTGKVAFNDGRREVFIPEGAHCRATVRGSGTPVWDDSSAALAGAVETFDAAAGPERLPAARAVACGSTLFADSMILWHLLEDQDRNVASVAFDWLEAKKLVPDGVTREATLRRDPAALAAWQKHLMPYWY